MALRIGLLGCGMIAEAFAKAASNDTRFEVVALHSPSPESMRRVARWTPHAVQHLSRGAFLDAADIDGIVVCTPHARHVVDAMDGIEAGKHILIEKPLATDLDDLADLERRAARTTKTIVALPHARYPFLAKLRKIIASGILGKVTTIHSVLDVPGPPRSNWYYLKGARGGASFDTFPYALSRVLDLLGTNVTSATGVTTRTLRRRRCLDGGKVVPAVDDAAALTLQFPSGQVAFIRSTWNCWLPDDHICVCGRRGDAKVDCWRNTLVIRCEAPLPVGGRLIDWDGAAVEFKLDAYDNERLKLEVFDEAVRTGRGNLVQAAYAMRLILGIPVTGGDVMAPPGIYDGSDGLGALAFGDDYV